MSDLFAKECLQRIEEHFNCPLFPAHAATLFSPLPSPTGPYVNYRTQEDEEDCEKFRVYRENTGD